jgi:hypothetical protein
MSNLIGSKFVVVDPSKEHERINSFYKVDGVWMCKVVVSDGPLMKMELEKTLGYLIQFRLPVAKDNINIALELLKVGKLNDKGWVVAFAEPTKENPWDIIDAVIERKIKDKLPNADVKSMHVGKDFLVVTISSKSQAKKLQKAKWISKLGARTKRNEKQVLILKQEV